MTEIIVGNVYAIRPGTDSNIRPWAQVKVISELADKFKVRLFATYRNNSEQFNVAGVNLVPAVQFKPVRHEEYDLSPGAVNYDGTVHPGGFRVRIAQGPSHLGNYRITFVRGERPTYSSQWDWFAPDQFVNPAAPRFDVPDAPAESIGVDDLFAQLGVQ